MSTALDTTVNVQAELQHLQDLLAALQSNLEEATATLAKVRAINATLIQD